MKARTPLSTAEREFVLARDEYRCRKCGYCAPDGAALEIHHVIEVCRGGTNEPENLHTLCSDCHLEWTLWEPLPYLEWLHVIPARHLVHVFARQWPSDCDAEMFKQHVEAIYFETRAKRVDQLDWSPIVDAYTPRRRRS